MADWDDYEDWEDDRDDDNDWDDYDRDDDEDRDRDEESDGLLDFLIFEAVTKGYGRGGKRGGGSGGCYVATCVYGSYDCPEVWTLRRFRDRVLRRSAPGRLFVRCYYALSPRLVRRFGASAGFRRFWRGVLDRLVARLRARGLEDTPYRDE